MAKKKKTPVGKQTRPGEAPMPRSVGGTAKKASAPKPGSPTPKGYTGPAGRSRGGKPVVGGRTEGRNPKRGKGGVGSRRPPVVVPPDDPVVVPPDDPEVDPTLDDFAFFDQLLSAYGFDTTQIASLRAQLWDTDADLRLNIDNPNFGDLLLTKLYDTQEFQQRFPAIAEQHRQWKSGQISKDSIWSPQQVLDYEMTYDLVMPEGAKGMFDKRQVITDLILGGVDPQTEFVERVEYATWASATAPAAVRDVLSQKYGVTAENMIGFYLDPTKGEEWLKKQTTTAAVRAAGIGAGIDLSWDWADRAVSTLGADYRSYGEFSDKMQQAAGLSALSAGLGDTVTAEQRADASLLGGADATSAVKSVQAQRTARFNQSGGATETQQGVRGLGRSSTT